MFLKVETAEGNGDEVLRECVIEKALGKRGKEQGRHGGKVRVSRFRWGA